jgi:hypothetical protein
MVVRVSDVWRLRAIAPQVAIIAVLGWMRYTLTSLVNISPTLERAFDSYSPSLAGNPLGVRFFCCTSRNREMLYSRTLLKISRNCLNRTGGNTLLTDNAARSREVEFKVFGIESQGFCGADASA